MRLQTAQHRSASELCARAEGNRDSSTEPSIPPTIPTGLQLSEATSAYHHV